MKHILSFLPVLLAGVFLAVACADKPMKPTSGSENYNELTPEEEYVLLRKGTERPFSGKLLNNKEKGTYICRRCNAPLYRSDDKFDSRCGWPSFDDEIAGAVKRVPDPDGRRTEIVCTNCDGHLGHVFEGEGFTEKDTRHCVNSLSMAFVPAAEEVKTQQAIFASGCFWGTEYFLQKGPGVISTEVGYIGGTKDNPTYKEVCSGTTGHAEAVRVIFDPSRTDYETLARLFFETHDPTQLNRQGPDIGTQYRSGIFFLSDEQKEISEKLIGILRDKGIDVVTELTPADTFWPAEDYHRNYYQKTGGTPYCHGYRKLF